MNVVKGSRKVNAHVEAAAAAEDSNAQKYEIRSSGDGYYTIMNVQSKHMVAVNESSVSNGMNLHQELKDSGNLSQKWLVHKNTNGSVTFINAKSGKVITMSGDTKTKDLKQYDYTDNADKQFSLKATTGVDTQPVDKSLEASAYADNMLNQANKYSSPTDYIIIVDRAHFTVKVYKGSKGDWTETKSWICATGKSSTPTTPGLQKITYKAEYFDSGYARLYWASGLSTGRLFHSVQYYASSPTRPGRIYDGTLGRAVSNGCIRLAIQNAKWIYDNCPVNTTVYIY